MTFRNRTRGPGRGRVPSIVVRLVAVLVAWSVFIAIVWLTKGGHISVCLPDPETGITDCGADSDLAQLVAWVVGVFVILTIGVAVARRR